GACARLSTPMRPNASRPHKSHDVHAGNPPPCPSPTRGEGTGGERLVQHHVRASGEMPPIRMELRMTKVSATTFPPPSWGRDRVGATDTHKEVEILFT